MTTTDPRNRAERRHADKLGYHIDEAAQVSGFSRSRLYQMMRSGELRYVENGRRRIIPRSELERLLGIGGAA